MPLRAPGEPFRPSIDRPLFDANAGDRFLLLRREIDALSQDTWIVFEVFREREEACARFLEVTCSPQFLAALWMLFDQAGLLPAATQIGPPAQ